MFPRIFCSHRLVKPSRPSAIRALNHGVNRLGTPSRYISAAAPMRPVDVTAANRREPLVCPRPRLFVLVTPNFNCRLAKLPKSCLFLPSVPSAAPLLHYLPFDGRRLTDGKVLNKTGFSLRRCDKCFCGAVKYFSSEVFNCRCRSNSAPPPSSRLPLKINNEERWDEQRHIIPSTFHLKELIYLFIHLAL